MTAERGDLDELVREVRQVIADNRKFLNRIMDDDFEPDEPADPFSPDEDLA